jgi:hypothetical protein
LILRHYQHLLREKTKENDLQIAGKNKEASAFGE